MVENFNSKALYYYILLVDKMTILHYAIRAQYFRQF